MGGRDRGSLGEPLLLVAVGRQGHAVWICSIYCCHGNTIWRVLREGMCQCIAIVLPWVAQTTAMVLPWVDPDHSHGAALGRPRPQPW